jgi:hypothetical protein
MILPGQEVRISDEKKRLLAGELLAITKDLEDDHSLLFSNIETWWTNYEGIARQKVKNFPFRGASNVIVPLIQAQVNAHVADNWNAIYSSGSRIWTTTQENQGNETMAKNVGRYINWQADNNDFNFKPQVYSNLLESAAIGCSVIAANWRHDERWLYTRGKDRRPQAQRVSFARGPILESVPREQMLWDTQYLVAEAPIVIREFAMSWYAIAHAAHSDPKKTWDLDAIEKIRDQGGAAGPSANVRARKQEHDSRTTTIRRKNSDHDVREIRIDWPILNAIGITGQDLATPFDAKANTPHVPIVVTLHRKTGLILRIIAEPYFLPYKPFFDVYYQRRANRGHGVGLAKKIEGMQAAATTIFNQQIDMQTRANSVWAKTNDPKLMGRPIDPSSPIYDPSMQSFEPIALPSPAFSNIQLLSEVQGFAERLTGNSDPSFGKDTTAGGHPTPATSTQLLLGQSQKLSSPNRDMIGEAYSRMGQCVAMLDQQFESDPVKLQQVLGDRDAESVMEFLFPTEAIPGRYRFSVTGLSRALNPDAEMQRAVMVGQMNQNYWAGTVKATEAMAMLFQAPLPPQVKEFMIHSYVQWIEANTEQHSDFLEAANVDDIERFTIDFERAENRSVEVLRDFAGRARELAQAGVGAPQPGVGGAQGGAAAGAGGASRARGGLPGLAGAA